MSNPLDSCLDSDSSPEALRRLEKYVQERLLASGVIPDDEANPEDPTSTCSQIVYNAWRQYNTKYYADIYIAEAIKFPPDPISRKHFSLKAFALLHK
jgi:hypothetical protein